MQLLFALLITLFVGCGHSLKAPTFADAPVANRASRPVATPVSSKDRPAPSLRMETPTTIPTSKTPPTLNRNGLGSLHTGDLIDESALGTMFPGATIKRIVLDDGEGGGWPAVEIRGPKHLAVDLRLFNDRVEQIWLMDSGIATSDGVRVGDPLSAVIRLGNAVSCIESAEGATSVLCSMKGTANVQYVLDSTNTTGIPQPVQVSAIATRKIIAIRVFPSRL